jgi:tetratricopeptide (TPR) repeat protein
MIPTLKEAIKLHQANQLDQAEESYLQILKNNPNVSEAFQLLGTLYLQKNNLEKSEEYLLKYLKVNSKSSLALNNLGILKKKIKNY